MTGSLYRPGAVDLVYVVDIVVRLRTYFFNAKGDLVQDRRRTRRRYLLSTNL